MYLINILRSFSFLYTCIYHSAFFPAHHQSDLTLFSSNKSNVITLPTRSNCSSFHSVPSSFSHISTIALPHSYLAYCPIHKKHFTMVIFHSPGPTSTSSLPFRPQFLLTKALLLLQKLTALESSTCNNDTQYTLNHPS